MRENHASSEKVAASMQAEIVVNGRMRGYRWLHLRAIQRKYVLSQGAVRQPVLGIDPEGVSSGARGAWDELIIAT